MMLPTVSYPYTAPFVATKLTEAPKIDQVTAWSKTWESHCDNVIVLDNCRWNILVAIAKQCEHRGHYETAESLCVIALDTVSEFSLKDPRVLYTIGKTANLLYKAGDTERSKSFFITHAKLTATIFGDKHVKTAESLSRLGMVYYSQASYPAAELCFLHAMGIYLSDGGETSEQVMRSRENLSHILKARGDMEGAARQLNRALTTSFRLFGPGSHQTQNLSAQLRLVAPCA